MKDFYYDILGFCTLLQKHLKKGSIPKKVCIKTSLKYAKSLLAHRDEEWINFSLLINILEDYWYVYHIFSCTSCITVTYAAHWGSSLIFVQKFNFVKNWILNFHDKNRIENSLISVFWVQNFHQFYLNFGQKIYLCPSVCCKTYFNLFNLSKAAVWQKGQYVGHPTNQKKQNHKLIYFFPFLFAKILFFFFSAFHASA